MTVCKYCPLLLVPLLTAGTALGSGFERRENAARTACLSGDYTKGVSILSELFVETEDAVYIYNQGRCFQQNRRFEEAVARFEEYLRVGKKLSKREKAEAQRYISDCRSVLASQSGSPSTPDAAGSGPSASQQTRERAARKACISGDHAKGAEILSELFVETGDLNFVFNQGRCFEQNGRYQDAINRFHEYARKLKDAGKPVDPSVERHIADCQAMLDKQNSPIPSVHAGQLPAPPPAPVAPEQVPARETVAVQAAPSPGTPRAGLRIAGLAVVGAGVAGLASGVLLNLKANSLADDLVRTDTSYSRNKESTRSSYETWGWVSYGVGAACVGGGAVLYFLGRSKGSDTKVAFVPVAAPDRVGAALQGVF